MEQVSHGCLTTAAIKTRSLAGVGNSFDEQKLTVVADSDRAANVET